MNSRFKIFFGTYGIFEATTAEYKINDWLKKNPDVYILDWQYQQASMQDHSICIRYDVFNSDECLSMKGERKQDDQ